MKILEVKDYSELSKVAAEIFAAEIIHNPKIVLGFATGSTPIGMYQELIKKYNSGIISFEECQSINLDEYCGIGKDNKQSYTYFMHEKLFSKIDIKEKNIYIPNGLNENIKEECDRYDKIIKELGKIDIQILGIGNNGHIGFNEPGTKFSGNTTQVKLTANTIEANKRFFDKKEEVPKKAYTMGIKGVMNSKKILLLASGINKSNIVYKMITGDITPTIPASILQLHPNVILVADEEALKKLKSAFPEKIKKINEK